MARKDIDFNTYVKRDLTKSQVDWSAITSEVTDELTKLRDERKTLRNTIAADTLKTEETLTTLENYQSQEVGGLALQMSEQSAKFLNMSNNLFKKNLISQSELAQRKQRILSNWKQFGNATKQWDTQYTEWMKRQDEGNASSFETWLNSQNAAFGNLQNIQGFVNFDTGALSLGEMGEDGKLSKSPGKSVQIQGMNNRMTAKVQNLNHKENGLESEIDPLVKGLGEDLLSMIAADDEVNIVSGNKMYTAKDGVKYDTQEGKNFRAAIRDKAKTITAYDDKTISILGDMIGGKEFVWTADATDEQKNDPNVVLIKMGPGQRAIMDTETNPEKYKTQKDEATDYVVKQMNAKLSYKHEIDMSNYYSKMDKAKFAEEVRKFNLTDARELRKVITGEKRLVLDRFIANEQIRQGDEKIAISDKLADSKIEFTESQIENITNIMTNRDLNTKQKYEAMILLDNRENAKLEFQKLLKLKDDKDIINEEKYSFPDLSNSITVDGDEYDDVFDYADDKLGQYIQMNDEWGNMDNFKQVEKVTKNFITNSIDSELLIDLQKRGSFEVKFNVKDSDRGRNVFNLDRLEISLGNKKYMFPPEEGEPGYDEAKKIQNLMNTNVGNGAPTQQILDWLEEHVLIPITEEGQTRQEGEKKEQEEPKLLSRREFIRENGTTGSQQGDKDAYDAYVEKFNNPDQEEETEEEEIIEEEDFNGDDII
tara:strand:- start:27284 stop:29407 length:2124 start_codon:yes stop_codon:yes gene_type:complete